MGSGAWFRYIICLKKVKNGNPKSKKGSSVPRDLNGSDLAANGASNGNPGDHGMPTENIAAIRIQTAFRAYKARKIRRNLKGTVNLRTLNLGCSSQEQASTTLTYLHKWSRIQAEIRARRTVMVTEARIRQRKLENQLKLEAKLHDLEVEWNNGPETMEEILARIHLREEAAVKRERAMAYAFSHQWRANSNSGLGNYELGKAIWGWSWIERWIAARPWESRVLIRISPKKATSMQPGKTCENMKTLNSDELISPNGKGATKARKSSYGTADQEANTKKEQTLSH